MKRDSRLYSETNDKVRVESILFVFIADMKPKEK